jgi:heat-inducible transcriptional repressor
LVHLQDLLLMLIVVLEQARLRRHLIRLDEPVNLSEIEATTNRMNAHLMGLSSKQIGATAMDLTPLEERMVDATVSILREEDKAAYRDHVVNGLRNILNQPEFAENERMRALIGGIEDGSLIQAVLDETPDGGIVRVIIGQENRGDMLRPLSVVICQYGIPDEAYGAVGAIGPTRMEYTRAIAGVKFMSDVMSDLVENARLG